MARITVEDCLEKESNRFNLVRLASLRAKELLLGDKPVTDTKGNKAIVSALREIADGKVRFMQSETSATDGEGSYTDEPRLEETASPAAEEIEADRAL